MVDSFGKLVVRSYTPRRRAVLMGLAVLLALGVLYAAFELGRYDAGFRVVDSVRGAFSASARIRSLEAANEKQRSQLEAAEVARRVDREGYKQIERSLGDMQSQIARLNQDLSFYRGLVQPDSIIHVKVQQMQIVPETPPGQYRLKFVLMQTGKPAKEVWDLGQQLLRAAGGETLEPDIGPGHAYPPRQPGILLPLLSGL